MFDAILRFPLDPTGAVEPPPPLAAHVALALAAAAGLAGCASLLAGRSSLRAAPTAIACALAGLCVAPAALTDGRARFAAADGAAWIEAALRDAPSRALVLARSTETAGGLLYAQVAWGLRPDATVIDRASLTDGRQVARAAERAGFAALPPDQARAWADLPPRARETQARHLLDELCSRALPARAVLWEPADDPPPVGAVEGAPLYRLSLAPLPPPARPLAERASSLGASPDRRSSRRQAALLDALASSWLARGDDAHAGPLADAALAARPGDPLAQALAAEVKARRGDLRGALRLGERALDRAPGLLRARLDVGEWRLGLGDLDGAAGDFERARRDSPSSPAPLVGLARVAHARGDDASARRLVDEALTADPSDAEARALSSRLGP